MTIEINMNKHRVKKKFKRMLGHLAGTGRDTGHRDVADEQQFADNWCYSFGHRFVPDWPVCLTCGIEKNYTRSLKAE